MKLTDLAEFLAILTILEPSAKICQLTAKLAEAGSTTKYEEGEQTDTEIIREIKQSLPQLEAELKTISEKKLQLKTSVLNKILIPD